MCGVFGFIAAPGNNCGPDLKALCDIANYNDQRRGGHAWGVSWIDSQGRLRSYKEPGRVRQSFLAGLVEDATVLIGHLRFTTQGTENVNANNHPHPCDGGWLVHNGVLPEYHDIRKSFSTPPLSDCDSEMLAIAWADAPSDDPAKRADWMLKTCQPSWHSPLVVLGLWKGRMVAVRQGNPLSIYTTKDGKYLSSLPVPGLKKLGDPKEVPNDSVTVWSQGGKGLWKRTRHQLESRPKAPRMERQGLLFSPAKFSWSGR